MTSAQVGAHPATARQHCTGISVGEQLRGVPFDFSLIRLPLAFPICFSPPLRMQSSFKSFPFPYSPSVLPLSFSSALSWFLLPFPFPRAIEHSLLHCPKSFPNLTCSLGSLCPFRLPLSFQRPESSRTHLWFLRLPFLSFCI